MQNQCDLRFQRKASQCFSGYAGRACAELLGHAPELLWVPWSVISDRSCHSVMLSDLKQFAVESVLVQERFGMSIDFEILNVFLVRHGIVTAQLCLWFCECC